MNAATHRHQQEQVKGVGAQPESQIKRLRQLRRIMLGHRGIDLHRHAQPLQVLEPFNRPVERARNSPEAIVGGRVGSIQADGDPAHAGFFYLAGHLGGDERSVGAQRHADAAFGGPARQPEQVAPKQRLASAQHQDQRSVFGQLIDDLDRLFVAQIIRRR